MKTLLKKFLIMFTAMLIVSVNLTLANNPPGTGNLMSAKTTEIVLPLVSTSNINTAENTGYAFTSRTTEIPAMNLSPQQFANSNVMMSQMMEAMEKTEQWRQSSSLNFVNNTTIMVTAKPRSLLVNYSAIGGSMAIKKSLQDVNISTETGNLIAPLIAATLPISLKGEKSFSFSLVNDSMAMDLNSPQPGSVFSILKTILHDMISMNRINKAKEEIQNSSNVQVNNSFQPLNG